MAFKRFLLALPVLLILLLSLALHAPARIDRRLAIGQNPREQETGEQSDREKSEVSKHETPPP